MMASPPNETASPTPSAAAWRRDELRDDPHARRDKAGKVRAMFAAIAHAYDLNNRLHSFGRDQAWRRAAVRAASVRPGDAVLDVACGTGDLTRLFAAAGAGRVVGLDFTPQMLDIARSKPREIAGDPEGRIDYIDGDAMALPFDDGAFDVVSIAFGIRNVADPDAALAEFFRVLRPGGRLVVLEFDRPRSALLRWGNAVYQNAVMPRTATLISRDRSGAYRYLPRSIETFLDGRALAAAMERAGFAEIGSKAMTLGVCRWTRGVVR